MDSVSVTQLVYFNAQPKCSKIAENAMDEPTAAEMHWPQSRRDLLFKQADHQGSRS